MLVHPNPPRADDGAAASNDAASGSPLAKAAGTVAANVEAPADGLAMAIGTTAVAETEREAKVDVPASRRRAPVVVVFVIRVVEGRLHFVYRIRVCVGVRKRSIAGRHRGEINKK
ncbi:hypothetical protein NUW54_g14673 [Trametes sanguinea]|uniref:Uncharacterized protein n=1 Tax=Trametes sanguinea TaxID=158606 RepID=A0ACC1MCS5_9APHY|nr:hypothetical protein NUW54_g14673 [Trametes sanguinea]